MKVVRALDGNSDSKSAQAFTYNFPQGYFLSIVIEAEGIDAFARIRHLGLTLETYILDLEGTIFEKFKKISEFLEDKLKECESYSYVAVSIFENKVRIFSKNGAGVILVRNLHPFHLTDTQEKQQSISGPLKPQDKIYLVNRSCLEQQELMDQILLVEEEQIDDLLENYLQQSENAIPIAVILILDERIQDTFPASSEKKQNLDRLKDIKKGIHNLLRLIFQFLGKFKLKKYARVAFFRTRKNPKRAIAGLIIICLVGYFLITLLSHWDIQLKKRAQFNHYYQQSLDLLEKSQNFENNDKNQAEILLNGANEALNQAAAINPQSSLLSPVRQKLKNLNDQILNIFPINSWKTFLPLALVKQDFHTTRIADSMGQMLVLDSDQKSLVSLDETTKTPTILAGEYQLGNAQYADIDGNYAYVYSQDKGVLKVSLDPNTLSNQKVVSVIKPSSDWGKIEDIYVFGDNIYLLDTQRNQVWKYLLTDHGYGDKLAYIDPKQNFDLSGGKILRIDGSVWILGIGGKIFKFTQGESDFYNPATLNQNASITNFYTADVAKNIYLLDSANAKLVVTTKTGEYEKEYVSDKFKDASDFIINEKEKKIYLLENSTIYQAQLPG